MTGDEEAGEAGKEEAEEEQEDAAHEEAGEERGVAWGDKGVGEDGGRGKRLAFEG